MPPLARSLRFSATLIALLVAAAAEASLDPHDYDATLPVPTLGVDRVVAGERAEIRWQPIGRDAEEFELVFSIDDGRHFDVRVSPELAGGVCRYVWRVPNLGVREARVRLRARIAGREMIGPVSHGFTIVPSPVCPPERWSYRNGEWWEDEGGEPFDLPGVIHPNRSPSLRSETSTPVIHAPKRAPLPSLPSPSRAVAVTCPRVATPTAPPSEASPSRTLPLRE